MDKILTVAWREFLVTVRTKAFLLTVVLMPALMIGAIYGMEYVQELSKTEELPTRTLAVVDHTGQVAPAFEQQIAEFNAKRPTQKFAVEVIMPGSAAAERETLTARVRNDELYGFLVLPESVLALDGEPAVLARRDNQLESGRRIEGMISNAVYAIRYVQADIDPAQVAALRKPIEFDRVDASTGEEISDNLFARIMTPFAFMFLLFMGTFGISQGLLTTLIEEKSSRVVELLLSAVSPMQLMAGKILGMAAVGFLLIAVWGGTGFYAAHSYKLQDVVTGYRLLIAFLYFVPGFLLISGLLAAIGSACNELKEAQSMVFPLSILTIVPMMFWYYLAEHPASLFSLVLSYVPPITPFVMILRVCADPDTPLWQIASTLALLWASVVVAMWAAAKIFRVGVLMYGKPPTPGELFRWVRDA